MRCIQRHTLDCHSSHMYCSVRPTSIFAQANISIDRFYISLRMFYELFHLQIIQFHFVACNFSRKKLSELNLIHAKSRCFNRKAEIMWFQRIHKHSRELSTSSKPARPSELCCSKSIEIYSRPERRHRRRFNGALRQFNCVVSLLLERIHATEFLSRAICVERVALPADRQCNWYLCCECK